MVPKRRSGRSVEVEGGAREEAEANEPLGIDLFFGGWRMVLPMVRPPKEERERGEEGREERKGRRRSCEEGGKRKKGGRERRRLRFKEGEGVRTEKLSILWRENLLRTAISSGLC